MASLPTVSPTLLITLSLSLLISWCENREFLVGGSEDSWKVPLQSSDSLNQWAKTQRFRIGDALIFKYDNTTESVHIVNEEDYGRCNTLGPHTIFKDGNSKVWFTNSGPIHFISGADGHCQMGLKLAVVVMSPTHDRGGGGGGRPHHCPPPSPSPSPSPALPPSINQAVALTSGAVFIPVIVGLGVSLFMITFLI